MRTRRDRWIWAAAGGAVLTAAGTLSQRAHMKQIASDPEQVTLREPAAGRSLGVRSADGTQLHVELFGPEPGAATFVLAHGWTENLTYWTYVIRGLSERGFRIAAYDLRGHGQSEPASGGDYAIDRFGEDLDAVLEASVPVGQRAIVAGHSLGAMSIAAWAEYHDVERLAGAAALLNTGVGDLIAEHLLVPLPGIARAVSQAIAVRGFLGARAPLPRFSTPVSHAAIRYIAFGPTATPAQVAFYERMLVTFPPDVRAQVGLAMSELELYHAVPRLTVPTIVIAGAKDRLTPPAHAERIAAQLPRLERLIVLPETGHMGPLERPREIIEALAGLATDATVRDSVRA